MKLLSQRLPWLLLLFLVGGKGLRAQATGPETSQQLLAQGRQALAAGDFDTAEKEYKEARSLRPNLAEPHVSLGLIYFEERRYEQALPELETALKIEPNAGKVSALLAMSFSELGRYQDASPGLEKCLHSAVDSAVKRMCGLELERTDTALGRDEQAVAVALELNRLYPDDPEVLYHTGKIYGNLAYLTMQKLGRVAPDSVWRHQAQAEALESQGSYDAAIAEYRKVLQLEPDRPNIHFAIGRALLARSRVSNAAADKTEAAQEFEQELRANPENGNAAYELAEAHREANDYAEAQRFFELALRYYPDFEEAHVGLADVLLTEQQPKLAAEHLQKALALNSRDEVAWYRLALAERRLGDAAAQEKALAQFKRLHAQTLEQRGVNGGGAPPSEITRQTLGPVSEE